MPSSCNGQKPIFCCACGGKDWKIALCSLSTGNNCAPCRFTASIKIWPQVTSASLFANKTRFPAFTADKVGSSPAAPTIAAITWSASGCAANSQMACSPLNTSVGQPSAVSFSRNFFAAVSSFNAAKCGRNFMHFSSMASAFFPPTSANARYLSELCSMTDNVLCPIEPVAPKITISCFCIKSWPHYCK